MDIYSEILSALVDEKRIVLATIVSTTGSTPAAAMSKMIVKQGGTVSVGTVGGGCMEGDVILHAHRILDAGRPEILTFHLNEDDAEAGLICGGSLDVLLEPLTEAQIPLIRELQELRLKGEDCFCATFLPSSGAEGWKRVLREDGSDAALLLCTLPGVPKEAGEFMEKVRRRQEPLRVPTAEGELILEPLAGAPPLLLIGGGHVSKYVSRVASLAGFRVTVADDREKYANSGRFPEAARTCVVDFEEIFGDIAVTPASFIVIVTRGHRYDEVALAQALKTPARYIGMIGSRRKVLTCFDHLREAGVSDEQLARVSAPVGIDIGAVTAEEIAVSIVAECIHARRNTGRPPGHMSQKSHRK